MTEKLSFLFFVVMILGFIVIQNFRNRRKQKQKIINTWGEFPDSKRMDKEESLRQAYEKLRLITAFDSEVDEITWYDLDLFAVFQDMNRTHSSVGSEALYKQLRTFNFNQKNSNKMKKLITYYEENPKQRQEIEFVFAELGKQDRNSVVRYLTDSKKKDTSSLALFVVLGSLPIVGLILLLLGIEGIGLGLLTGSLVFNLLYSLLKKTEIGLELMSMSYLVQTLYAAKKLKKIDHPYQKKIDELMRPFHSVLRFSFAFKMGSNSELDVLLDYLNMLFMIPFITYHYVFNRIKDYKKEALALWQTLGDLEVAYAILNYRTVMEFYSEPEFYDQEKVEGEMVYHPLLEAPVANPVHWERNTLVSGSNASGKSTYVKSVAINCILAQTIHTCLADKFSMKRGHVLTSMAVEDDVLSGDSYFVAEIKSLKRVLDQIETKERCYIFIDEILRGTNTVERIAASGSIVNWLDAYPSLAFVATHDIELTEILKHQSENVHFKEEITEEDGIQFNYILQNGPATSRNALLLLETMGFPDTVIEQAENRAKYFDQEQEWLTYEK